MGIPILSDIIDGVKWFVDFFVDKVPKPVKFFIFLMLLLLFGTAIPLFIQLSGVHCNSDKETVKISSLELFTNIELIRTNKELISGEILEFDVVHPKLTEDACFFHLYEIEDGTYNFCIDGNESENCRYYYRNTGNQFNCFSETIHVNDMFEFFGLASPKVCLDDAYEDPDYDLDFADDLLFIQCNIPDGYFWSFVNGYYYCYDNATCGNNTIGTTMLDEKLEDAEAEVLSKEKNENSYLNLVSIKCDSEFKPRLTFFGINIFDYKLWIFLTIVFVMGYFLVKLKSTG